MCAFAAFNLHNADIKTLLNVFTLVPAMMFTFRIFAINNDSSTISVTIVAVFWMYYGMGLICDVLLGSEESYAAVQLALVGALGVTAYRGIPPPCDPDSDDFRTIFTGSYSVLQQTQSPKYRKETKYDYRSRPQSLPTARGFSTYTMGVQGTQSSCSMLSTTTAQEFTDELLQSTLRTAVLSDTETAMEMFPSKPLSAASCLLEHRRNKFFEEVNDGSVVIDYDGFLAEPFRTIRFNSPKDTQVLSVTNIAGTNLKWTVKTNAVYEIRAYPAQGVLGRGETAEIKVILNSDNVILPGIDSSNDKLAIDYETSGSIRGRFKRQLVQPTAKRRYQFDILYKF